MESRHRSGYWGQQVKGKSHEELLKENVAYRKAGEIPGWPGQRTGGPTLKQQQMRSEMEQRELSEKVERQQETLKQRLHDKGGETITPRKMRKPTGG